MEFPSKKLENHVLCLVTQSCVIFCDPVDCSPPGSSVHGDSPGKNTGVGCHAFLQEIFTSQGSNPGLPHYRWILCHLSHQGSPRIPKWVPIPSPGHLPDPGIELGSPALQADSLQVELTGNPECYSAWGHTFKCLCSPVGWRFL